MPDSSRYWLGHHEAEKKRLSSAAIETARSRFASDARVSVQVMDASRLKFADCEFDLIRPALAAEGHPQRHEPADRKKG